MDAHALKFRSYRPDDLSALFKLDKLCFEEPFRFSRGTMRRLAESRHSRTVVAVADGELAGFCIIELQTGAPSRVGYIGTIDVHPAYRRHGLARQLLILVEQAAAEAGCDGMWLHVFSGNAHAIGLYEANDYSLLRTERGFYGPMLDALVYGKAFAIAPSVAVGNTSSAL